jgi:hypothetical protein
VRAALTLFLVVLLGGCASTGPTRRVDRTHAVEVERSSWLGTTFEQDGVQVDNADLQRALSAIPAAVPHVESARRNNTASIGLLLAGVGFAVGAVVVKDTGTDVGLWIGAAGAIGGSLYFQNRATSSMVAAVREYNASLPRAPPPALPSPTSFTPPRRPALSLSLGF